MSQMKRAVLTANTVLGTDALVVLDGRWSEMTIDCVVRDRITSIQPVHRTMTFTGYEIYGAGRSLLETPNRVVKFTEPIGPL